MRRLKYTAEITLLTEGMLFKIINSTLMYQL
jgi:hypothetical protein